MDEYERAKTDAVFGIMMAENMLNDSVFMFQYGRLEARAATTKDDDPRSTGG